MGAFFYGGRCYVKMAKENKAKAGRKSKYDTHVLPRLEDIGHWAREGLIEEEMCKRLGIAMSTFQAYKNQYPELMDTLKKGKEYVDYMVEDSLLKRALGYEYEEKTYETMKVPEIQIVDDEEIQTYRIEEVLTKNVVKQVAPDVTAIIFWLKNRQPDKWRDKQNIEHSGQVNKTVDLTGLSIEELRRLAKLDR